MFLSQRHLVNNRINWEDALIWQSYPCYRSIRNCFCRWHWIQLSWILRDGLPFVSVSTLFLSVLLVCLWLLLLEQTNCFKCCIDELLITWVKSISEWGANIIRWKVGSCSIRVMSLNDMFSCKRKNLAARASSTLHIYWREATLRCIIAASRYLE